MKRGMKPVKLCRWRRQFIVNEGGPVEDVKRTDKRYRVMKRHPPESRVVVPFGGTAARTAGGSRARQRGGRVGDDESDDATNALRQQLTRLRAMADSAQDAILMIDPEGLVTFWNPAAGTHSRLHVRGRDRPGPSRAHRAASVPRSPRRGLPAVRADRGRGGGRQDPRVARPPEGRRRDRRGPVAVGHAIRARLARPGHPARHHRTTAGERGVARERGTVPDALPELP